MNNKIKLDSMKTMFLQDSMGMHYWYRHESGALAQGGHPEHLCIYHTCTSKVPDLLVDRGLLRKSKCIPAKAEAQGMIFIYVITELGEAYLLRHLLRSYKRRFNKISHLIDENESSPTLTNPNQSSQQVTR